MQALQQKYYTPEEYLKLEESAEGKSEYIAGQIVIMAGGLTNHNRIVVNLTTNLNLASFQATELRSFCE